jgi:hypothetical protein
MPIPDSWREVQSAPGYVVCGHSACTKKARDYVTDHTCCGKPYHDAAHERARAVEEPPEPVYTLGDAVSGVASLIRRKLGRRP